MWIRTALALLALAPLAAEAEPRGDELVLRKRQVQVLVNENLARVTLTWKVSNSGLRPLEGEVIFKAPKGAVVTESTLLKHIASANHRSKLFPSSRAFALYESAKGLELKGEDLKQASAVMAAATRAINKKLSEERDRAEHPLITPSGNPKHPFRIHNPNNYSEFVDDPALVEWLGEDSYRLRFFPVPANDDQTVSITLAIETSQEGADRTLRIPLAMKDNFVWGEKTDCDARLAFHSSRPLEFGGSTSHRFEVQKSAQQTGDVALIAREEKPASELAFRYRLATDAALSPPQIFPGVSQSESLLIIADADLKQAERHGTAPAAGAPGPDDLKRCGFIRAGAAGCCEHSVVTSDPARLKWARDHGLSPRARKSTIGFAQPWMYEFDYVAHSAGCPLSEVDPIKLKALAAAEK
jgi:hypothetical protein